MDLLEVGYHVVKSLRNIDVMVFLRVFTSYSKRKRLKKIVQNELCLQSEQSIYYSVRGVFLLY